MSPECIQALIDSTTEWEKRVENPFYNSNCPLCIYDHEEVVKALASQGVSVPNWVTADCGHCPIYQRTGQMYCKGTLYYKFIEPMEKLDYPLKKHVGMPFIERQQRLAQDMVDFLYTFLTPNWRIG